MCQAGLGLTCSVLLVRDVSRVQCVAPAVSSMAPPTCRTCSCFLNKKWGVDRAGKKRPRNQLCCPTCEDVLLCFGCCQCEKTNPGWGGNRSRGSASSNHESRAPALAPTLPGPPPPLRPGPPPLAPRLESRSRSREGRRCKRAKITKALLDQWRRCSIPERPMPSGSRPDAGLVPGGNLGGGTATRQSPD